MPECWKDANFQLFQLGIIEAFEVVAAVVAISEYVSRAVERISRQQGLQSDRHIQQQIAFIVLECLARQTSLMVRPPKIIDARAEIGCEQLDNFILVAFRLAVRLRHISGIGTNAQHRHFAIARFGFCGRMLSRGQIVKILVLTVRSEVIRQCRATPNCKRAHSCANGTNLHINDLMQRLR